MRTSASHSSDDSRSSGFDRRRFLGLVGAGGVGAASRERSGVERYRAEDIGNPDSPIQELRVSSADSLWHDAAGLRAGMTLAELVELNGAPVSFYGLEWDYGGTVQDWHGGKLANAVGNKLFHRVTLSAGKATGDRKLPSGDTTFRSDDPKWPEIGKDMIVAELGISWPHEGED